MIEVLITMLILTVVLMGLAALQITTVRQVSLSNRANGALRLAQSVLEKYHTMEFVKLPSVTPDWETEKMKDGLTDMVGVWEDGQARLLNGVTITGPYSVHRLVETVGTDRIVTVRVTWKDIIPGSDPDPQKTYKTMEVTLNLRRRNL